MNIFEKVKMIAQKKNITIAELEKLAAISNGSIGKWSTSMPKADSLCKVAKVLETEMEYFLFATCEEPLPHVSTQYIDNPFSSEEQELLTNYKKLDSRGKHHIHTVIYEELDRIAAKNDQTFSPSKQTAGQSHTNKKEVDSLSSQGKTG